MAKNKENQQQKSKMKSSMHETEMPKKQSMHSTPEMHSAHSTHSVQSKAKNHK